MGKENYFLGIDIGGTKIKTVILKNNGEVVEQDEVFTEDRATEKELWKKKIIQTITEKSQDYSNDSHHPLHCGISAPGLVDAQNRTVLHMPERLKGIEKFDWSAVIGKPIAIVNDGHSACLAEYEFIYRSAGIKHLLMLTLGTGVGGGIIINGELYQGHLQRAGHVGHMTLNSFGTPTMTNMPGSLEYEFGNFSVSERTEGRFNSVRELVKAYENGDVQAGKWWLRSVRKLAAALASLTNIIAPECIVLGGGIMEGAGDSLLGPLKKVMADYEWRPGGYNVEIKQAELGRFAGAIGAALFVKNKINCT
ncbi:ROK family protein [Pareuzebyella sediminis]|uniref:ROK family protein n=1 Tax=Pareuzebyella sediminis TaxID=2607998 RepID=UPI0011EF67DC|nr:ROK family protein [Pareuzebyella sediminis]